MRVGRQEDGRGNEMFNGSPNSLLKFRLKPFSFLRKMQNKYRRVFGC